MNHSCEKCLDGADCTVPNALFSTLRPLPGYRSMSWNKSLFGQCPVPASCNTSATNLTGVVDGCAPGHSSELCSQCMPGWATSAKGRVMCTKCPEQHATVALYAAISFVTVCIFTYLVWDNLDGARDMVPHGSSENGDGNIAVGMPFHSISIRIVSSYLQVAGLRGGFIDYHSTGYSTGYSRYPYSTVQYTY